MWSFMREPQKLAEDLGITKIEVSISDTKDHAMAFAVGEGEAG